jgi:hypothetical protein
MERTLIISFLFLMSDFLIPDFIELILIGASLSPTGEYNKTEIFKMAACRFCGCYR